MNTPTYTGPKQSALNALESSMVVLELKRLGEEPYEPHSKPVLFYDNYGDTGEADPRATPAHWTPEQVAEAQRQHEAWCQSSLRNQLFRAHIRRWIESLLVKGQWAIIQAYDETTYTDSEKRSTARAEIIRRATHATWLHLKHEEEHGEPTAAATQQPRPARTRTTKKAKTGKTDLELRGKPGTVRENNSGVPEVVFDRPARAATEED
jgi:hypothetical protein